MCGEHTFRSRFCALGSRSSPRVRGTLLPKCGRICERGIIPACAGNTGGARSNQGRSRDHPRVCGEHRPWATVCHCLTGSSPRVRGTPISGIDYEKTRGIIPACAGNTPVIVSLLCMLRDHPRVCGEHPMRLSPPFANWGSSPRVRGTQIQGRVPLQGQGIIPACAGNTLNNPSSKSRKRKNKLHFNQFAEEMQRCLTVRFCAMGSFVVKVQQAKHGFQTVVWRLW